MLRVRPRTAVADGYAALVVFFEGLRALEKSEDIAHDPGERDEIAGHVVEQAFLRNGRAREKRRVLGAVWIARGRRRERRERVVVEVPAPEARCGAVRVDREDHWIVWYIQEIVVFVLNFLRLCGDVYGLLLVDCMLMAMFNVGIGQV